MKLILLVIILLNISNSFAHDKEKIGHKVVDQSEMLSNGKISNNIIDVTTIGMVCDFCAQSIEKVFMKRQEVQGIKIDLNNQKVIIFLTNKAMLDDAVIYKLFEDAGYGVDKIDRDV